MEKITASDFAAWKENSVTKAFLYAAEQRILDAMNTLSNTAGLDVNSDNFIRGFISAYRELAWFRIDDLEETKE